MLEAHEQTDRGVLRGVRKQSQRASVSVSVCVCVLAVGVGWGGRPVLHRPTCPSSPARHSMMEPMQVPDPEKFLLNMVRMPQEIIFIKSAEGLPWWSSG